MYSSPYTFPDIDFLLFSCLLSHHKTDHFN